MSDENALLAAIAADPAEDTPRLVYADWLDEHDQPLRAEFIRLQCGANHAAALPAPERRKLGERIQYLIENHRRDLIGPQWGDLAARDVTFDRGFAAELRVTALQFVLNPQPFAALRPVPKVRIRNLTLTQFDRFIVRPELTCVVSIAVNSPGRNAAQAIAGCPHLTQLDALDWTMAGHRIGDAGLDALARSNELPQLVHLDAPNNEISDAGVERLISSPLWRRLKRLNLANNDLTAASATALANAPPDRLDELALHGMRFGPAGRQRLTRRFGDRVQF